jgi:hypothetical protein
MDGVRITRGFGELPCRVGIAVLVGRQFDLRRRLQPEQRIRQSLLCVQPSGDAGLRYSRDHHTGGSPRKQAVECVRDAAMVNCVTRRGQGHKSCRNGKKGGGKRALLQSQEEATCQSGPPQ